MRVYTMYHCSGPEANHWAAKYHSMLISDAYDTILVADDNTGAMLACGGDYVAEVDEYGNRYLYRFANPEYAREELEAVRHLYETDEVE